MSAKELTVWFYHQDKGDAEQWVWHQAQQPPAIGDYVVTPKGSRWLVIARTWVEGTRCNVTVRDLKYAESAVKGHV